MAIGLCLSNWQATLADCPSADLTGDCFVNFEDFVLMGAQWLTGYDFNDVNTLANEWLIEGVTDDPCNLDWVDIDDPGVSGHESFIGQMSKYEITNGQYCEFLNAALASGDITVSGNDRVYGANGSNSGADFVGQVYLDTSGYTFYSQITLNGTSFSPRIRNGYSMSNHPVVEITWYGATAFCNYYGYRLPTEWEWQAVADYDGSYFYGCGTTINQTKANYYYANPLGLTSLPKTSPVNYYPSYGYGMNDMAGNVWEWTSSFSGADPVVRGGCFSSLFYNCKVSVRSTFVRSYTSNNVGFRACR